MSLPLSLKSSSTRANLKHVLGNASAGSGVMTNFIFAGTGIALVGVRNYALCQGINQTLDPYIPTSIHDKYHSEFSCESLRRPHANPPMLASTMIHQMIYYNLAHLSFLRLYTVDAQTLPVTQELS